MSIYIYLSYSLNLLVFLCDKILKFLIIEGLFYIDEEFLFIIVWLSFY